MGVWHAIPEGDTGEVQEIRGRYRRYRTRGVIFGTLTYDPTVSHPRAALAPATQTPSLTSTPSEHPGTQGRYGRDTGDTREIQEIQDPGGDFWNPDL